MITINNLNKIFDNGVVGLKNINCSFKDNSFNLIRGHSGAGKTTFLQIMALMQSPSNGEILVDKKNILQLSNKEKTIFRKENFGFIFQSYLLHEKLKAIENVMLALYANHGINDKEAINRSKELLELVGLKNRMDHYPNELSGGEQQRVAIARALANSPKYIFADEPTGNLDEENEVMILDLLKMLSNNHCIITVSHNVLTEKYADNIFDMSAGELFERRNHE